MAFWTTDIAACLADFGETITTDLGTFTAIFDRDYIGVGEVEVESSGPAITCASTDVTDLVAGTQIEHNGIRYVVRAVQPDGTGITVLRLQVSNDRGFGAVTLPRVTTAGAGGVTS